MSPFDDCLLSFTFGDQHLVHNPLTPIALLYFLTVITINCRNSERDGNTRPPDLPLEKPVCRSGSNPCLQEATVGTGHGTTHWFQIGKGVHQGCILSPCLFNFHAEYIMRNAGLEETQAGIKIAGRKSITSDMKMTPPLWQKAKRS